MIIVNLNNKFRNMTQVEITAEETTTASSSPIETPGTDPKEKPEVEPEELPEEEPGIQPSKHPGKKEDDDDDDDDEDDPFEGREIGDDPDTIKTRTTVMLY